MAQSQPIHRSAQEKLYPRLLVALDGHARVMDQASRVAFGERNAAVTIVDVSDPEDLVDLQPSPG